MLILKHIITLHIYVLIEEPYHISACLHSTGIHMCTTEVIELHYRKGIT